MCLFKSNLCSSCYFKKVNLVKKNCWQNDWGDKNQAVFNSNAEISRKTDAGTAILLNHPSLQFGNVRKDSGGRILTAEIRCDCFVFQVINVYAFTSSYPKQNRVGYFNQIYDFANINFDESITLRQKSFLNNLYKNVRMSSSTN